MKKNLEHGGYILFWTLFFIACSSLNGEPLVQLKVSTSNSTEIGNALENPIVFTKALVGISEIEFEQATNCNSDSDQEFDYEGPFVANLLTQESVPSLEQIKIESTSYCKFKFKIEKLEEDEMPAGADSKIQNNSVYVAGSSPQGTPFVAKLEDDQEYELKSNSSSGFVLSSDQVNTLFLIFDLPNLFASLDLDTLEQTSGTIYIDKDHNQDAYEQLKNNMETFSKLVDDSNSNDEIDDNDDEVADGED